MVPQFEHVPVGKGEEEVALGAAWIKAREGLQHRASARDGMA